MRSAMYRRALARDLDAWIADGLVEPRQREAILAHPGGGSQGWSASSALATAGGVFVALAVLTFVAANWDGMSRILRLGVLMGALAASLVLAHVLLERGMGALGHACAMIAAVLFGAGIILIAQTYHLQAHHPTGVLIWALGALAIALAVPSRPTLAVAAALGVVWLWTEHSGPLPPLVAWAYLFLWPATAIAANRLQSTITMNVLAVGAISWVGWTLSSLVDIIGVDPLHAGAAFALIALAIGLAAGGLVRLEVFGARVQSGWWLAWAFFLAFALQFRFQSDVRDAFPEGMAHAEPMGLILLAAALAAALAALGWRAVQRSVSAGAGAAIAAGAVFVALIPLMHLSAQAPRGLIYQMILGAAFFAASLAAIAQGARQDRRFLAWLGVIFFIIEAGYVYFETFRNLLNTSLFFLAGGLLLMALSWLLLRFQKRLGAGAAS